MNKRFYAALAAMLLWLAGPATAENAQTPPSASKGDFTIPRPQLEIARSHAVELVDVGATTHGSGVLLNGSWVLTALHVVERVKGDIFVIHGKSVTHVTLVVAGRSHDLALLKLAQPWAGISQLSLAPANMQKHSLYFMYSNRQGGVWNKGEVGGSATVDIKDGPPAEVLQNAELTGIFGDSGSGLYNSKGQLGGILVAVLPQPGQSKDEIEDKHIKMASNPTDPELLKKFRGSFSTMMIKASVLQEFLCGQVPQFAGFACADKQAGLAK